MIVVYNELHDNWMICFLREKILWPCRLLVQVHHMEL